MDDALKEACKGYGWEPLYRHYLPEGWELLDGKGGADERICRSPFPGSTDKNPSLWINVHDGVWTDYHMGARLPLKPARNGGHGGNLVQFIAFMHFSQADPGGRLLPDYDAAERDLRRLLGLSQPVDLAWYTACVMRLAQEGSPYHAAYQASKPWTPAALAAVEAGWCAESGRLVWPVKDMRGALVNCRMYRPGPGAGPKVYWKGEGVGPQNLPFPASFAWERQVPVWMVEGEGDAISLISVGIPAVSGTYGAGSPVPFMGLMGAEWMAGRDVVVCTDSDSAGEGAGNRIVSMFVPYVASIRRVRVPEWPGMPMKRDVSDFIMHRLAGGATRDAVRAELRALEAAAEQLGADAAYDADPVDYPFDVALDSQRLGVRVETTLRVLSKSASQHMVPSSIRFTCGEGHPYCRRCAMVGRGGAWQRSLDHRSATVLAMATSDLDKVKKAALEHFHIVETCPDVRMAVLTANNAQILQVGPPQVIGRDVVAADDAYARRTEAFVVRAEIGDVEPGHDYRARGFVHPLTKNQKAVFLLDRLERVSSGFDGSAIAGDDLAEMREAFWPPGRTVWQALLGTADDLSTGVTGILMRPEFHVLYMAVFHCPVEFDLAGEAVTRGWLEAFVVGDTRCGKSAAFKALSHWYGVGSLLDCKMVTVPGLLGAVEQSSITGERYVLPGVVPLNDGRGPLCFDEFTGPRYGRTQLMESMSSARAEGVVTIRKAAHATLRARVRSIWLANPGEGRLLADIPGFGVERVKALVGQPEDVARFDIAMAVTQQDVPLEVLLAPVVLRAPRVPQALARRLIDWSRAREPSHFAWDPAAVVMLIEATRMMVATYDASIPLVEGATQRHKVAKVAAALAVCTFSTPDGVTVRVTEDHVVAAHKLFSACYDSQAMAYHSYSARQRYESTIPDPEGVRSYLEKELGDGIVQSLRNLERLATFSDRTFRTMVGGRMDNVAGMLSMLSQNRCIESSGYNDSYRLSKAFVHWIREYIRVNEHRVGSGRPAGEEARVERAGD